MMEFTYGSLFSGIGGIDLGLDRAGMRCLFQVEIDGFCRAVLRHHWPGVLRLGDIRDVKPGDLPAVDVLAGGFPCQPVSLAGKRLGTDDHRWLWPEFLRVVRFLRPRYVLIENVPGLRVRGLRDVLGDLAQSGYDAEWQSLSAQAFGAPHIRERVFILAYPQCGCGDGLHVGVEPGPLASDAGDHGAAEALANAQGFSEREPDAETRAQPFGRDPRPLPFCGGEPLADADRPGLAEREERDLLGECPAIVGSSWWSPQQSLGQCDDGLSGGLARPAAWERGIPRTVPKGEKGRVERLKALGNAVVPQCVEFIGRKILEAEARR